ncbi:MAG TPA: hypothetical protein DCY13_11715 [Verrucomicrobiales bacterium]|nr:hypothetical protein [Verrucomicrobiales bacterium]
MQKLLLPFLICLSLLAGCMWEPLPDVVRATAPFEHVPDKILAAFVRVRPKATIERVETYSFKGRVTTYRVFFRDSTGAIGELDIDREGQPISSRTQSQ